ncbi:MAG: RrF2 family transcriptional regulator [Moheibacter sp.]
MFSKSCEYGIRALLYIATQSLEGKRVKVGEIAENSGCPEAFTAKLLGDLKKSEIVCSQTGPYGGFYIEIEEIKNIKLSQIVFAIDGDSVYNGCGLGLAQCDENNPCPMHHHFVEVRNELKKMLETTCLYDLATELKAGETVLVRK